MKTTPSRRYPLLLSLLCGSAATLLLLLLLSLLCSTVVYCSSLSERIYPVCAAVLIVIGSGCGAYLSARMHGRHGLLIGLLCSAVAAALAVCGGGAELHPAVKILNYLLPGMIGGVVGVNSTSDAVEK